MLRYYVYFYFCSAAVTIYVGFLDLRFEEINNGVYPAFDLTDDNESNVELARSKVKRETAGDDQPATGKQLVRKIKEFFRHYESMKLKRLRGQGPLDRKVKAPLVKTTQEKPSRTMKRSKRKAETVTQSHREEEEEEEATKTRLRRAWRKKKPSTMAPVHESDSRDVFLSDPNAFFEHQDDGVEQGVANQLFVENWMRTLGYFLLLQVLIFVVLFSFFFIYGYYKYEVWKLKQSKVYKNITKMLGYTERAEQDYGETEEAEKFNEEVEAMGEKALDEDEARQDAIEVTMRRRSEQRALQRLAQRNIQMIKKERRRRAKIVKAEEDLEERKAVLKRKQEKRKAAEEAKAMKEKSTGV